MNQNEVKKVQNWGSTLLRIWKYLDIHRRNIVFVLFLVTISSGLGLLGPFLIGRTVDHFISIHNTDTGSFILVLCMIALVYLFFSVTSFLQNYWMIGISQTTVFSLREQLFKKFHRLPIAFFDRRQHGELMSRVTNDIDNVSQTLNSSIIQIFSSALTLVGTLTVMFLLSPLLTMISMTVIPLMYFGMKWITNRTGKLFKEQQKHLGDLNGFIQETISGQTIVKTFSQEENMIAKFMEKNENLRSAGYWAQTYSGFIPKLMNVLNNLNFAVIVGAGGMIALQGHISIGTIIVFTEYSRQFTRPLNDLANQFNTLLSAVAGADRVFDILDQEEEKNDTNSKKINHIKGSIIFKDVFFSYDQHGQTLKKVSFHAQPGETLALVGPTGAGKTTIINLLARFYDPNDGEILVDGTELVLLNRTELRKEMGFVLQDPYIFQGTIRENIRYGRLEATNEEIESAAKMANAHSFIVNLPNGYDTVLKQDGGGISQGQRQLLSIARVMLLNPSILVLDEATSNIDTITELKIQEALSRLMKGKTSIVIAHRLNTIRSADQILVLHQGSLIERGSHEQLLEQKGFYHELYHSQLKQQAIS